MERTRGIAEAVSAVRRGELIVLPTDTVYGVGADAFTPSAVTGLLNAKGRGRTMPPPVLVGSVRAATALIDDLGTYGQDLIDEFWPGALTLVCRANPNLMWDLGETKGTVAVRMPMDALSVELLKETGPLAVSSANISGRPAARDADEAEEMLGDSVEVYLDGGRVASGEASTIVDLTGPIPRLLRLGAISEDKIRAVVGVLLTDEDDIKPDAPEDVAATPEKPAETAETADAEPGKPVAAETPKPEKPSDAERKNGVDPEAADDAGHGAEPEAASGAQRGETSGGDAKPSPRKDEPGTAS